MLHIVPLLLLFMAAPVSGTGSDCVRTLMRQPMNSEEVHTQVDYDNDSVTQLFTCFVGYHLQGRTFNSVLHRNCHRGQWSPAQHLDCLPVRACGGLWYARHLNDKLTCYLLIRAKSWEHSRRMCWGSKAELLTLENVEEERWLITHLTSLEASSKFVADVVNRHSYIWLGLSNFQDGKTWRWVNTGEPYGYSHWSAFNNQTIASWSHFAYISVADSWAWHFSTSESERKPMYAICEKSADYTLSQRLPSRVSRMLFIPERSPFTFTLKGVRQLITNYIKYEWGPIYLQKYPSFSSTNYLLILNTLLTGDEWMLHTFINTSTLHDYRLQLYDKQTNSRVLRTLTCTGVDRLEGKCGFKYYEIGKAKELMLYMNIIHAIDETYSGTYKLVMPSLALNEHFYLFTINNRTGLSSWSAWSGCLCRLTMSERLQYQMCARAIKPQLLIADCGGSPAVKYEIQQCNRDVCAGELYEWNQWTDCNSTCGPGHRSRYKLCDAADCGKIKEGELVYDIITCNTSCAFGEVRRIDIDEWILNNPELVNDLKGVLLDFKGEPSLSTEIRVYLHHLAILTLCVYVIL